MNCARSASRKLKSYRKLARSWLAQLLLVSVFIAKEPAAMKLSKRVTLPISMIASVIGAFALITSWEQHRLHLLGAVPYLLLLACPLMHLLGHGGHRARDDERAGHAEHSRVS
jgi:hypothetical protein